MAESKKAAAKKSKAAPAPKKSKAAAGVEEAVGAKAGRFDLNAVMADSLQEIEKKTGLSSNGFGRHCQRLSTGLVALDMYLDGGLIPGGWYTTAGPEQSAKSTLTMTLVAACIKQKFNGVGALFDYEGSSDEDYIVNMMKNFGITNADRTKIFGVQDPDSGKYIVNGVFRYYDPTNGEAFFQYMQMLRRRLPDKTVTEKGEAYYVFEHTVKNKKMLAGQYDMDFLRVQNLLRVPAADTSMQSLTVVDSYPAMLPDQQDDDDPSGAMALQARMFSDGIKRFRGGMRRKMMTILGVNQLRERPAQQHGDPNYEPCLIGSTRVLLANGSTESLKNIVDQKLDVEVMSFDKRTGEVSAKRIIDWKDNGPKLTSDLVTIMYRSFDHNGVASNAQFTATKNHKIWSDGKWVKAGDLVEGDVLHLSLPKDCYSDGQERVNTMFKTKVLSVGPCSLTSKYTNVYDLTVEDNHTYFVGGPERGAGQRKSDHRAECVAVSNCGNALKFYCVHPETIVDYLDDDGKPTKCTAHEYLEQYGNEEADMRPPIRVPSEQGWAVPTEVFETDGGKYADRETFMVRTARKVLRGSAGHSILTATKVKVPHPYSDNMNGWSEDLVLPSGIPAFNAADDEEDDNSVFGDWDEILAPRVGWSRLQNIRYRDNDVWAFTDTEGLHPFDINSMWGKFIKEVTPEFHKLFARWTEHEDPITERLAAFNGLDSQWLMQNAGITAEAYDVAFQQFAYIEELVNVYLNFSNDNQCVPERITEIAPAEPEMQTKRYIDFSVGGSWYSSGIISHNSDVRIRVMPRAVPDAFKNCNPQRGVIEEPSVEFGGKRVDRYKFISGRTIKNKLGGIPNQEFWARIWEADGKGNARGFDPVYDSYFYLKQIGLLVGQRNKMKFLDPVPLAGARRAISWQELKVLIVGKPEDLKELCVDLGVKPFNLRTWCFKYCKSEEGRQRCRDSIVEKQQAAATDDE